MKRQVLVSLSGSHLTCPVCAGLLPTHRLDLSGRDSRVSPQRAESSFDLSDFPEVLYFVPQQTRPFKDSFR